MIRVLNQAHDLRVALEQYMLARGFDLHGPNVEYALMHICVEIDSEIEHYITMQKEGKLNDLNCM